ncbi:hypothetical protein Ddc_10202 [Ditylenchus destructor]|nr:hypothetical protein Ddc_10202 [Ditylenchus destructor]
MTPGKQVSRLKTKINFERLASIELSDSEDPEKPASGKERLQKLELLAAKLKAQLKICAYWIIFTAAVYLLFWYNSECWALPLQNSPCKRIRALPLIATDRHTLADAVDEFTLALRALTDKFRDTIETQDLTDRQAAFNVTKNAVGQLLSQHSSDLVGFGVRKREDARLKDVEEAIGGGYMLISLFCMISGIFMLILRGAAYATCKQPEIERKTMDITDEQENSQNTRLKQLKRRVSLLYIATFICIAVIVTLYFVLVVGQYYYGSSTVFKGFKCNFDETGDEAKKNCPFTDYRNFSTKLETALNREFSKIDMFMTAPIEVRRAAWLFEIDAIDTHIEHHQDIKQYHVDRRTMPQEIGHILPDAFLIFISFLSLLFCIGCFIFWASEKGSVSKLGTKILIFNNSPLNIFYTKPAKMTPGKQMSRFKTKINFNRLASIELSDCEDPKKPADVKERLQKLELLAKKLKAQLLICAFGIMLIVFAYFIPWYNFECWALPFQESPCKRIRDLPLIATNQSTLADAVDEFTLELRALTDKFRDTIEMTNLRDSQAMSNATKNAVGQLFSQHSLDLVGFGARKKETERLEDVEEAISQGYMLIGAFCIICSMLMMTLRHSVKTCKNRGMESKSLDTIDKQEYSQNARLKQLKRRVSLLYFVTFICIAAIVTLFFIFVGSQYFYGTSTIFARYMCNFDEAGGEKKRSCPFTDYRNFSAKLETALNREFSKIDMFMTSPIEVRRAAWLFEIDDIDTHIEHYQDLKQYHVDRRTMPQEIGHVLPDPFVIAFSFIPLIFCVASFICWASEKGSVWRLFKCLRIGHPKDSENI